MYNSLELSANYLMHFMIDLNNNFGGLYYDNKSRY